MNFRSLASVAALMVLLLASWPAPAAALTFFDHPLSFEDRDPGENLGPYRAPEKPAAEEDKPVIAQPQDTTPNGNKPKEEVKEDPNEEVSVDPDTGKVSVYKPPTVVSSFVNAPTKENAQAYLDWIESKSKKTQTAMNMLTEVVKEKQEAKKKEALKAQEGRDKPEIVTFITPECPHCASQVMALNGLLREGWLGRVEVHAIMKSDAQSRDLFMKSKMVAFPIALDQGEFAAMGIDVWPTTLVLPAGTDKVLMYKGVVTTAELKKLLQERPTGSPDQAAN